MMRSNAWMIQLLVALACAACGGQSDSETWGDIVSLFIGLDRPVALALDETHVYWAEIVLEGDVESQIRRVPRAGGTTEVLHAQLSGILSLATDDTGIYFTDTGEVMRLAPSTWEASSVHPEGNGMLVQRDGELYWWSHDADADEGRIYSMPLDGASTATLVGVGAGRPTGALGIDDTHLYWGVRETGEVLSLPRDGSSAEATVVATGQCPHGVAVDDTHVYWHHDDSCHLTEGVAIRRAPRSGAAPADIETVIDHAAILAQGSDGVYYTASGWLYRATSPTRRLGYFGDRGCERNGAVVTCQGPTALVVDDSGAFLAGWSGPDPGGGWVGHMARP